MGDKVTSLWKRASDESENRDEIPWHLRYGGRTLGTFAGIGMYQQFSNNTFHINFCFIFYKLKYNLNIM